MTQATKSPDPYQIPFFFDFMLFLKYLEEHPIKRTAKGNISLYDIQQLKPLLKEQNKLQEHEKYGWKITSESNLQFLTQIKIIASSLYLTYNRKGKLFLSKNGSGFLHNIDELTQYKNTVITYWKDINWEYFEYGSGIQPLQNKQNTIWQLLLKKGTDWIDFKTFCQILRLGLSLKYNIPDKSDFDDDTLYFTLYIDIYYGLFYRNLERFGCVEVLKKERNPGLDEPYSFRCTEIGLYMFKEALLNP